MNLKTKAEELELEENEYTELIHLFIETSVADVETLESALLNKDPERIAHAAHSMKGAAVNLGFNSLYETAKKIEMAAKAGNLELVSGDLETLKKELASIQTMVECRP